MKILFLSLLLAARACVVENCATCQSASQLSPNICDSCLPGYTLASQSSAASTYNTCDSSSLYIWLLVGFMAVLLLILAAFICFYAIKFWLSGSEEIHLHNIRQLQNEERYETFPNPLVSEVREEQATEIRDERFIVNRGRNPQILVPKYILKNSPLVYAQQEVRPTEFNPNNEEIKEGDWREHPKKPTLRYGDRENEEKFVFRERQLNTSFGRNHVIQRERNFHNYSVPHSGNKPKNPDHMQDKENFTRGENQTTPKRLVSKIETYLDDQPTPIRSVASNHANQVRVITPIVNIQYIPSTTIRSPQNFGYNRPIDGPNSMPSKKQEMASPGSKFMDPVPLPQRSRFDNLIGYFGDEYTKKRFNNENPNTYVTALSPTKDISSVRPEDYMSPGGDSKFKPSQRISQIPVFNSFMNSSLNQRNLEYLSYRASPSQNPRKPELMVKKNSKSSFIKQLFGN